VFIWAARLGLHIGIRHTQEDYRYAAWRRGWLKRGQLNYYIRAFLIIFMLQAFFSVVVNSAALYVTIYDKNA